MDMCNPADRVPQSDHAAAVADSPLREWKKGPDVAVQAPRSRPNGNGLAAAEQRQDDLRRGVGDRQRLGAELLLHLQGLKARAFLGEVGVHQVADAGVEHIRQLADEDRVTLELLLLRAEVAQRLVGQADRGRELAKDVGRPG